MDSLRLQNINGKGWELAPQIQWKRHHGGSETMTVYGPDEDDVTVTRFWWGTEIRTPLRIFDE